MYIRAESVPAVLAQLGPDDELPPALRGRMLSSREVAQLFRVSSRTVTAWATEGRLPSVRTPGGHHRFPVQAVRELLQGCFGAGGGAAAPAARTTIDLRVPGAEGSLRQA